MVECHGGVMFRIFMILATNLVSIARRIFSKERNKIIGLSTDLRFRQRGHTEGCSSWISQFRNELIIISFS